MKVDHADLAAALGRARKISDRRGLALDRILISQTDGALRISSTDGVASSVEAIAVAAGPPGGSFSASSSTLCEAVKHFSGEVTMTAGNFELTISDGRSTVRLAGLDPHSFPTIPALRPAEMFTCDLGALGAAMVAVSAMSEPKFSGIHNLVRIFADGTTATVMASNPHSAARLAVACNMPAGTYGIPASAAADVFKCGPYTHVGRDGGWMRLSREGMDVAVNATKDVERFDDLFADIPTVKCQRLDLVSALRMSTVAGEEHRGVLLGPDDAGIMLEARGDAGVTRCAVASTGPIGPVGLGVHKALDILGVLSGDEVHIGYANGAIRFRCGTTDAVLAERRM